MLPLHHHDNPAGNRAISEVIGKPRGSPAFNHSGAGHTSDHPRMIHRLPANYIYIYIFVMLSVGEIMMVVVVGFFLCVYRFLYVYRGVVTPSLR